MFKKHSLAGTCGIPVEGRRIYIDVDTKGSVNFNHGPADPRVIHWPDGRSWTVESIYDRREYGRAIFGNLCVEVGVCIAKQRKTIWWEGGRRFPIDEILKVSLPGPVLNGSSNQQYAVRFGRWETILYLERAIVHDRLESSRWWVWAFDSAEIKNPV